MTTLGSTAAPAPILPRGLAWIVNSFVLVVPLVGLGWIFFSNRLPIQATRAG